MNRKGKLETFIQQHKETFDECTPSDALWHRIERELNIPDKQSGKVYSHKWMRIAAAVAVFLAVSIIIYQTTISKNIAPTITHTQTPPPSADSNKGLMVPIPETEDSNNSPLLADQKQTPSDALEEEALYHYSRLIEIKQEQMAKLTENEPELSKEFATDMEALESEYKALKQQFKEGLNREQLLEAMITNLKMQADLLNKQLNILKEIQKKKNENYKSL